MADEESSGPEPRCDHYAAVVGDELCVFGGRVETANNKSSESTSSSVYRFDILVESWAQQRKEECSGFPGLYCGACCCFGEQVYVYGGTDDAAAAAAAAAAASGGSCDWRCALYRLDTLSSSWTWRKVADGPVQARGCGLLAYAAAGGGNKLLLFGGYGVSSGAAQPLEGSAPSANLNSVCREWMNDIYTFDLSKNTGVWSSPGTVSGTIPPPCSFFSLTLLDDRQAVLFGGDRPDEWKNNDVFVLDLIEMHWSKLDFAVEEPCPVRRSCHSAVCLGYGGDHPQLLITGGLDKHLAVLSDVWLLDVMSRRWKEVKVPGMQARRGHTSSAFVHSATLTEVVIFGGCNSLSSTIQPMANTTLLQFESCPHENHCTWHLTGYAEAENLGKRDRVRKKMAKLREEYCRVAKKAEWGLEDSQLQVDIKSQQQQLKRTLTLLDYCCQ